MPELLVQGPHGEPADFSVVARAARAAPPPAGTDVVYEDLDAFLGEPKSVVPPDPGDALGDAGWWLANLKDAARANPAPVLEAFPPLAQGARAGAARAGGKFTAYDGFVPEAGPVLDPRTSGRPVSPTELERAGSCPFAYFLERALGIEALDEAERDDDEWLDPATRGTLLHALYADMMREARRRKRALDPVNDLPWLQARADERLEALRADMPPSSPEVFAHERLLVHRDLGLFLQVEAEAAAAGVRPIAFEIRFGRDVKGEGPSEEPIGQPDPVVVPIRGGYFSLVGRIDRVDRLPRGGYEVVDYKTGIFYRKKYKGTFRQGRQLQLVLYAIAAEEMIRRARLTRRPW